MSGIKKEIDLRIEFWGILIFIVIKRRGSREDGEEGMGWGRRGNYFFTVV